MTRREIIEEGLHSLKELHAKGEYKGAFELTGTLLATLPGWAEIWTKRGKLAQLLDDPLPEEASLEDAEKCFQTALALAPGSPEPDIELGHFFHAVRDAPEKGDEYFAEAERKALGSLREALQGRLACAAERGNVAELTEICRRIRQIFPDDDELEALCESVLASHVELP